MPEFITADRPYLAELYIRNRMAELESEPKHRRENDCLNSHCREVNAVCPNWVDWS